MEFRPPSLLGSSQKDSPSLTGWGITVDQADQEMSMSDKKLQLHERLRMRVEPPKLEDFNVPKEARSAFYSAMGAWIEDGVHGFFLPPDAGDGHCEPDVFVETIVRRLGDLASAYNGEGTQSPIEDMLLGALLWIDMDYCGFPAFDQIGGPEDEQHRERRRTFNNQLERLELRCWLSIQAKVAGYAVDFLLWFEAGKKHGGIVIECDGHAFHEKTKEQAARDKKRDREIFGAGYPVVRFSGSEVFRDVAGCSQQIKDLAFPVMDRVAREAGLLG